MSDYLDELRWLCDPMAEAMGDGARLSSLIIKGEMAADEVDRLREEVEGWKRVAVYAAIPLEAMTLAGVPERCSPMLRDGIRDAVAAIRAAFADGAFPPRPTKEVSAAE